MKKLLLMTSSVLLLIFLSSCDAVVDTAIDCIDNDGPEFLTDPILPAATANLEYETEIVAAVESEPRDDKFDYIFRLKGDLPEGVYLETFGYSRRAFLRGTPTQPGEYKFVLNVSVSDLRYNSTPTDHLCFTSHSQEFTLIVLPNL